MIDEFNINSTTHPSIVKYRERARERLGATEDEIRRGFELHEKLFTCDAFGFLPNTWSKRACERLRDTILSGASRAEIAALKGVLSKLSHMYDPVCRKQFLGAVHATGLNCTVLTMGSEWDLHHSLHRISWYTHMFDMMRDHLHKVVRPEDFDIARRENKLGVVCSTNCSPAHGGLKNGPDAHHWIDILYRLGIRVMHLTYNRRNWVGDGCLEPANGGLSLHGRDVVRHLNEIGMAVDTPHTGRRTTLDAAELSSAPIMATHTGCESVFDHPRCKSDEELKAIAAGGGFVGIFAVPFFLGERGDINALLDHVDHAVDVMGVDHVGIGTDDTWHGNIFEVVPEEYIPPSPPGGAALNWHNAWEPKHLEHKGSGEEYDKHADSLRWTNWPWFTVGLVKRGYGDEDIAKIAGGNFRRVLTEIQTSVEPPA